MVNWTVNIMVWFHCHCPLYTFLVLISSLNVDYIKLKLTVICTVRPTGQWRISWVVCLHLLKRILFSEVSSPSWKDTLGAVRVGAHRLQQGRKWILGWLSNCCQFGFLKHHGKATEITESQRTGSWRSISVACVSSTNTLLKTDL